MSVEVHLRLNDGTSLIPDDEQGLHVDANMMRLSLHDLTPGAYKAFQALAGPGVAQADLNRIVAQEDGMKGLFAFMPRFTRLLTSGMISHHLYLDGVHFAAVRPLSSVYKFLNDDVDPQQCYVLSRFAHIRREQGYMALECPLGNARILIYDSRAAAFIGLLSQPYSLTTIQEVLPGLPLEAAHVFVKFLLTANALSTVEGAVIAEDQDETLRQWEPHDLLFHAKVRMGRAHELYGMSYRFLGEIPQQPVVKQIEAETRIPLYKPDIDALTQDDRTFSSVLEMRKSRPRHAQDRAITDEQLGEFLYRCARIRYQFSFEVEASEVTETVHHSNRPYPNAGASYELELYLSISNCDGIEPGFYHYAPEAHQLEKISGINDAVQSLLWQAQRSWMAEHDGSSPQILLTFGACFQRVSWKYESIAYALTLKNVGVLMQTMSLVAEAMGLAGCPIGGGNADVFTRALGSSYYVESSVGEFILGARPEV